ncbi:MAG: B12-binding domain-containing radical SAM protein [Clostridia bacterium]|nr:B12-binding domain-containing radical SAM protein [Clostridia bacterium]
MEIGYNVFMNTILTTLNAKYIHSSLALRNLKAYCQTAYPNIVLLEFTINDPLDSIISVLAAHQPDLLGFSCYIWNIRPTLDIIDSIKKVLPECMILLGGPEVSYNGAEIMKDNSLIDFIVTGEGEQSFHELLDSLVQERSLESVDGLIWRKDSEVMQNCDRNPILLDSIPFAYEGGIQSLQNKIIYYETSRGCPFQCQYCLSSAIGRVRFLQLERVKKELFWFVRSGVKQVKLVDRTFNCSPSRAKELFEYLIQLGGSTNFHFEMAGDLIDEEMLEILKTAPAGMFQFEIGVQSTNEDTLNAIQRKTDINKIEYAVSQLINMDNIHIHLDLIVGLPEENLESLAQSINRTLSLKPHKLQLGFLKLLRGTGLREESQKYNYRYTSYPPYEVLSNHVLSFSDLSLAKKLEELLELYYNSHRFEKALAYLASKKNLNYFAVFAELVDYWERNEYFQLSHSYISLYEYLLDYVSTLNNMDEELFHQLLCFDFVRYEKPGKYPKGLEPLKETSRKCRTRLYDFLRLEKNLGRFLPEWKGYTPKQILRWVHVEVFDYPLHQAGDLRYDKKRTVILFDYLHRQGVKNQSKISVINI